MFPRIGIILLVFACAWIAFSQSPVPRDGRQSNIDSFELVWKTVAEKYWDPKRLAGGPR
jgi:hypothetical protein